MNKILQAGELKQFKDRKEAEDWSQKDARIWRESILTKDMKKVFEKVFTKSSKGMIFKATIKQFLITFNGQIDINLQSKQAKDFEKIYNIKLKSLIEQIRLLDYGLKKAAIGEDIILFHSFTQDDHTAIGDNFWNIKDPENEDRIDLDKFMILKNKMLNSIKIRDDYFYADVINKDKDMPAHVIPAYMKIIAPKGSKGVFFSPEKNDDKTGARFIFARNSRYKITDFKIVENDLGKELIEIAIEFL